MQLLKYFDHNYPQIKSINKTSNKAAKKQSRYKVRIKMFERSYLTVRRGERVLKRFLGRNVLVILIRKDRTLLRSFAEG